MELLIASLLIYHFDLSAWWYPIAAIVWVFEAFIRPVLDASIK